MRILVVGTGGVGSAFAAIAQRRSFFDRITLADLDPSRPQAVVDRLGEHDRFNAARVDASSEDSIIALIRDVKADAVLNATDPRFNPQIFDACLQARVTYLDMAATLSQPHPEHPYQQTRQARRLPVRPARELGAGEPAVVDNEWSMREYDSQAVVWQTAINPAVALELLAEGTWKGVGVLGPESFPAQPFLDKLAEYGAPHGILELTP